MRGHVDSETLAASREGLLPRRKAGQVTAHVARCARCAGLDAQLAELPALLARSPAPPMPAALTARIEAALAAEAAARTTDTAAGPATGDTATAPPTVARGHRKAPAPGPGRRRLALRAAAVAAAVVVVAGGGYGLIHLLAGGFSASPAAAPALGRQQHKALAPAGGSGAHAAAGPSAVSRPAGPLIIHSGTNYQPGRLQAQVRATLLRFGHKTSLNGPARGFTPAPSAAFAGLSACVPRVVGSRRVDLADYAHYEGKPAVIIVTPGGHPNTLRVLVVGTSCSATAPGPIFSTLLPSGG